MSKDKTAKGAAAKKGAKTEKAEEFEYGIADLAKELDRSPAGVRQSLRAKKIAKAGKSYGWNSKSEMQKVAKQLAPAAKAA